MRVRYVFPCGMWVFCAFGQAVSTPADAGIRVKVSVKPSRVDIRWAVDDPLVWKKARDIGYVLKRYTVAREGKMLDTPELFKFPKVFTMPPLDSWKSIAQSNDHAAIIAQAVYGKGFEVSVGSSKSKLEHIMEASEEAEQRFAYALMAADLDFVAATFAGWGYTDTNVRPDERYLYMVEANPDHPMRSMLKVKAGSALARMSEPEVLPKPQGVIVLFKDKKAFLSWDYLLLQNVYTQYSIEKSEDGKVFKPVNAMPLTQMNGKKAKPSPNMVYIDSLAQNNRIYSYRIRGKTIFGDFGPYCDAVSGKGTNAQKEIPEIRSFEIGKDHTVRLDWEFPEAAQADLMSFALWYSDSDAKNSYTLLSADIEPDKRSIRVPLIKASGYFKIYAIGKDQSKHESFAALVQEEDDTPPQPPGELHGAIDSLGIVSITWKGSAEKDLEGYHVFRTFRKDTEPVRITPTVVKTNALRDTVQIRNLNAEVFYYVAAMDKRKNQSELSPPLKLEKPDVIPPQAPLLEASAMENGQVALHWPKSFSEDVVSYGLYRTANTAKPYWQSIYETSQELPQYAYTDKNIAKNTGYTYYLIATDKHALKSDPSRKVSVAPSAEEKAAGRIGNATGSADRHKGCIALSWTIKPGEALSEILIYRQASGETEPSHWMSLPGNRLFAEDKHVLEGIRYTYFLKAIPVQTKRPIQTEKITVSY